MKTTRVITGVRVILNIEQPVVVFQLDGHADVVRNPRQALVDLQNSGRIADVKSTNDPRFTEELHRCVGAQLSGDLKPFKAGDKYTVTEGHPAIKAGTAQLGDQLVAEKDGVWVEGFLSIPKTPAELLRQDMAREGALVMMSMFGFATGATNALPTNTGFTPETEEEPEHELIKTATGKTAKAK